MVDIPAANLVSPGDRLIDGTIIKALINKANSTVTSFSFVNANGITGSVTNPTTTPALTLSLGAITPTSIVASGSISGSNLSGSNTGDQTIILTGNVTGSGTGSFATTIANLAVTNGMLAGSIAASKLVGTDIATVGTITAGIWHSNVIGELYGGTNQTTYATGDLLQASASNTLSKLSAVATGNALISGGVTTASSWGKVGLTTHISGTLGAANGGTGVANNASSTLTISGNFGTTITVSNTTAVTLPTSGTLTTLATVVSTANTFTKAQSTTPVAVTSTGASIATDASLSNIFTHTLTESTTLANPTNLVTGTYYTWKFTQASSAKTLAYGNLFKWPGGTAMTVSTGNGAIDIITSLYDGTSLQTVFSQAFA